MIDRKKFFDGYRREFRRLSQSQVDALEFLLSGLEQSIDNGEITLEQGAYILGTIKHEVDDTYEPIEEYGKGKGKPYGRINPTTGKAYYGRGYTQNTWLDNYRKLTKAWNDQHPDEPIDFVKRPELLLQRKYAWWATVYAMRTGLYTGRKLRDYINARKTDHLNARRIVNLMDRASLIAGYAEDFETILREATAEPEALKLTDGNAASVARVAAHSPADALPAEPPAQQTVEQGAVAAQVVVGGEGAKPVVSKPEDPAIPVEVEQPPPSNAKKSIIATVVAAVASIGLSVQQAFTHAYEAVKSNPLVTLALVSFAVMGVCIYWKYMDRLTRLEQQKREQAHLLTMEKMRLAASSEHYTVSLVSKKKE